MAMGKVSLNKTEKTQTIKTKVDIFTQQITVRRQMIELGKTFANYLSDEEYSEYIRNSRSLTRAMQSEENGK